MTRTGRPANSAARLDILRQLANGASMAEIVRGGAYTRGQVHRYVSALKSAGLIVPDPNFSHLPTDGPGALRFALTASGALTVQAMGLSDPVHGKSTTGVHGKSADGRTPPGPGGVVGTTLTDPTPRYIPNSTQLYAGGHNDAFRMELLGAPTRNFHWDREWLASGVPMRSVSFGVQRQRVNVQLCRETTLLVTFAVAANKKLPEEDRPRDVRDRTARTAAAVRALMEKGLGCALSEPRLVSKPKHSILNDPAAAAIRAAGITIHGEGQGGVGVDDTPEPGTLEFTGEDAVDAVREYTAGVRATGRGVEAMQGELAALRAQTRANREEAQANRELLLAIAQGVASQAPMVRELLLRVAGTKAAETGKPSEWGSGRAG